MGGFQFLDLVIGMVFIYFLLSLICVSLQELKANYFKERAKDLKKWITDTFNVKGQEATGLGDKIWENIIIDGLTSEGRSASYIPTEAFVSALLDEIYYNSNDIKNQECAGDITKQPTYIVKGPYDFNALLTAINDPSVCIPTPLQRVLRQVHAESHQNLETFRIRIERWFEMAMQRNTGAYKKKAQKFSFISAIIVTILLNVDTIKLADYLYRNPEVATQIANTAEQSLDELKKNTNSIENDSSSNKQINNLSTNINKLNSLKLPIGWSNADYSVFEESALKIFAAIVSTTVGWIITIFAVSLGAPFWFDTLNKLVNLRAAGKMPNSGTNSQQIDPTSKDNQTVVG